MLLSSSRFVVRLLAILNIAFAVIFLTLMAWWSLDPSFILDMLSDKYGTARAGAMFDLVRAALALGAVGAVPVGIFFGALLKMIDSLSAEGPFTAANVTRLRTMGFALLGIQILDILFGALGWWADRIAADWSGWTPSIGGWLAVLLLFVLARIFAEGIAMRDDLEGTI